MTFSFFLQNLQKFIAMQLITRCLAGFCVY